MWESPLVKLYNVIYACYMTSFVLIMTTNIILRWQLDHPIWAGQVRITLMACNVIVLMTSLCTFEIKSLINEGFGYFESFYNKNDMMLFALSVAVLVEEIILFKKNNKEDRTKFQYSDQFVISEYYRYDVLE